MPVADRAGKNTGSITMTIRRVAPRKRLGPHGLARERDVLLRVHSEQRGDEPPALPRRIQTRNRNSNHTAAMLPLESRLPDWRPS